MNIGSRGWGAKRGKPLVFPIAVCALLGVASPLSAKPPADTIVLKGGTGDTVEISTTGPFADPHATQLAQDIQALDQQIAKMRKQKAERDPAAAEVKAEMLGIAVDARDDALSELDLALAVARKTSAGALDPDAVARADADARAAKTVLSSRAPSSIAVTTSISTSVTDATLHYMSAQKHRQRSTEWSSYSDGERMRIGRYVFRVNPARAGAPGYEEFVLVISDPTRKRLTPMQAPNP
ncbi:hypothetical protein [Caulobacter hibisci]|uniref:Uncharacterized protein n=1 Tax=Caulobacter hibisci TaxID=2035993 RepID=A0ABS0T2Q2_9CAUL|nr:hypothetical protein [Caulobacter hibisci]MBI1686162.1 hypothetical protein [Caulobacter hibisci]